MGNRRVHFKSVSIEKTSCSESVVSPDISHVIVVVAFPLEIADVILMMQRSGRCVNVNAKTEPYF